jgi:hypothetical protein
VRGSSECASTLRVGRGVDLNNDGAVDVLDLLILLDNWG